MSQLYAAVAEKTKYSLGLFKIFYSGILLEIKESGTIEMEDTHSNLKALLNMSGQQNHIFFIQPKEHIRAALDVSSSIYCQDFSRYCNQMETSGYFVCTIYDETTTNWRSNKFYLDIPVSCTCYELHCMTSQRTSYKVGSFSLWWQNEVSKKEVLLDESDILVTSSVDSSSKRCAIILKVKNDLEPTFLDIFCHFYDETTVDWRSSTFHILFPRTASIKDIHEVIAERQKYQISTFNITNINLHSDDCNGSKKIMFEDSTTMLYHFLSGPSERYLKFLIRQKNHIDPLPWIYSCVFYDETAVDWTKRTFHLQISWKSTLRELYQMVADKRQYKVGSFLLSNKSIDNISKSDKEIIIKKDLGRTMYDFLDLKTEKLVFFIKQRNHVDPVSIISNIGDRNNNVLSSKKVISDESLGNPTMSGMRLVSKAKTFRVILDIFKMSLELTLAI